MGDRREHTRIDTRFVRQLLRMPDRAITRLVGPPVVVDGRVLNRSAQLMLRTGERLGMTDDEFDPVARRQQMARLTGLAMPRRNGILVNERRIDGPAGSLRLRMYRRYGSTLPAAIMYFHGGGWVVGDLDTHDGSARLLADVTGCLVVSVDYRLAPEHPFPAAPEDCIAAYAWVCTNADDLSIAPGRVGVMGDSAGGNLAAVVSQQALSRGLVVPAAQGLIYPSTDARMRQPSHTTFATGFGLDEASMHWYREQYLPNHDDWRAPMASPIEAKKLAGQPPALVVTAGFDPLRDEGKAYADALAAAGVRVSYRCYDDQIHGFFGMGFLPGGMEIATEVCTAMGDLMAVDDPDPGKGARSELRRRARQGPRRWAGTTP